MKGDLRYVMNIETRKRHVISGKRMGYTLCGEFHVNRYHTSEIPLGDTAEINCKKCKSILSKLVIR